MEDYKICHECGSKMLPNVNGTAILAVKGQDYQVPGITSYVCTECGSVVYPDNEVKKIEDYIKEVNYGV